MHFTTVSLTVCCSAATTQDYRGILNQLAADSYLVVNGGHLAAVALSNGTKGQKLSTKNKLNTCPRRISAKKTATTLVSIKHKNSCDSNLRTGRVWITAAKVYALDKSHNTLINN